jgi:hypothetical protein
LRRRAPRETMEVGRQRGCDLVAMLLEIGNDPVANPYPINTLKSESEFAVRIGMDVYILG